MRVKQPNAWVQDKLARLNIDQRTPAWYAARATRLTASDVAAAIGCNPNCSRAQLMKRKVNGDKFTGNAATEWGQLHEDTAIARYEHLTGEEVFQCGLFVHPQCDEIAGSPDGITNSKKLIEVKCPYRKGLQATVPAMYMPQIQTCLEVVGAEACDFIQYIPGSEWRKEEIVIITVPRERQWFDRHYLSMRSFVENMKCAKPEPTENRPQKPRKVPRYMIDD